VEALPNGYSSPDGAFLRFSSSDNRETNPDLTISSPQNFSGGGSGFPILPIFFHREDLALETCAEAPGV